MSALSNISTATIAFPAEDFVPPIKQTALCWAFNSTVQTPFCCLDFGLALFAWSPIKPAASHITSHPCPSAQRYTRGTLTPALINAQISTSEHYLGSSSHITC